MPLGSFRINGLSRRRITQSRVSNTFTVNGNTVISSTQSRFGGTSAFFDGNQDWITVNGEGLNSITGDFSIQFWFHVSTRPVSTSGQRTLFSQNLTFSPTIFFNSGNLFVNFNFTTFSLGQAYTTGWNYFHFYRNSGSCNAQVNSSFATSATNSGTLFGTGERRICLGSEGSTSFSDYFNGYIDEVRVSNIFRGTTVPTAAFTNDANTLLLMHMDGTNGSTTFTDDVS